LIAQWLSERLGHQFVVENRPGAGGNIASMAVARSPADGYTLLFVSSSAAINATFYENSTFNFLRDIAPVASLFRQPLVMLIDPSVKVRDIPEFIAYAKANPGKINMASAGNGSPPHLAGELFNMMAGIKMQHVPYRSGAEMVTALLGGHAQVIFVSTSAAIEHIRTGKLTGLAVTTGIRSGALPDIPAVGDFVPGFEASNWYGLVAPKDTSAEIIEKLNKEINSALADPKMNARLADLGGVALPGSPADFGMLIAADTEKWGKVVRVAGIKPE
jgi:tripartite-type tricarboxylate transporter receptor subunit TctC